LATFDIVTIFPAMIEQPLAAGVLGRAIDRGTLDVKVRDLRDFTTDRHRVVDDVPYGGGPGMVLKPDPIFRALDAIEGERGKPLTVIMTSPQGRQFTQAEAERLSRLPHLVLLCGRYEGFDDRVRERVTEELSIGDYVLTGGELPALVILDAVARFVPGVVGDEQSVVSGNHAEIRRWRKREALARTLERRPDLLAGATLDEEEQEILRELKKNS
jgi:tRNA (guanine37-N1)-methyltransferase